MLISLAADQLPLPGLSSASTVFHQKSNEAEWLWNLMYLFSLFKTQDALLSVPHRDAEILESSHPTPDGLLRVSERQSTALNLKICHFYATSEKGEKKKKILSVSSALRWLLEF